MRSFKPFPDLASSYKVFIHRLEEEFKGYNPAKLKMDAMAGITVTAVALPLALAFGISSGATAHAGLITAVIAGLVIGGLSGCSFQISGPTGAMSAILLPLVVKYGLDGIFIACVIAGVFLVIAGILNFGKVISIIPSPVITGFTSGIALIIMIGQIDNFLGLEPRTSEGGIQKLFAYFSSGVDPNWQALLIGAVTVLILVFFPKKWNRYLPASLAALIITTIACTALHLQVKTIGEIPRSFLPDRRLPFNSINMDLVGNLLIPAISIALLGMIETLLCGEVGGRMKGEKMHAKQELIAQGIGNIIIPFFGGVPATAAIARTSVAIKSGGQTRLVSIFHAAGLAISMLVLAPIMSKIPMAALAGVLMVTAFRMNEWAMIKYIFSKKFKSAISKYIITMVATVVFDLTIAILAGVVFSCMLFIKQISDSTEITIDSVDEKKLAEKHGLTVTKPLDFIRIVYLTGPIFFPTVHQLSSKLENLGSASVLILSMRGVPFIDTTGIMELNTLLNNLKAKKCRLMLSGVQKPVFVRLKRSGIVDEIGDDMVFWSAEQAIASAQDMG